MSENHEPRTLGHADESDGIEEYDNPLPDWWVGLFWLTIIWGIGYAVHYHFIADRSQEKALAAEMAAAEARWPEQAQAQMAFSWEEADPSAGQQVYAQNCFPCHGQNLEGGIGPSFVDEEWIHGGQAADILRIIRDGVPAKGMVAWQGILTPEQIVDVTAYVIEKHVEATDRELEEVLAEAPAETPDAHGADDPVTETSGAEDPAADTPAAAAPQR